MNKNKLLPLLLVTCILCNTPAYAYLDPTSGSIIFQGLIGGMVGGYVFIKNFWYRIVCFFKKDKNNIQNPEKILD